MPNHKLIVAIRILQVGLAALSIKLLTSSLPLAEIAKYGIVVSLAGMGTTAISSPVTMFIYRNANAWRSIQKLRLAVNFYVALILVCSICSLIVAIPISMFLESINLIHGKLFYITIILNILIHPFPSHRVKNNKHHSRTGMPQFSPLDISRRMIM